MSEIKIPEFSKFSKTTVEGADLTEYVHKYKNYQFSIQHDTSDETSYGWSAWIISPIDQRCIGSGYILAEDAYQKLLDYIVNKRFAANADYQKIKSLETQLVRVTTMYHELDVRTAIYNNQGSEFVHCKSCRSRLARKYIKGNKCPLCGNDLRSAAVVNRLKRLQEMQKELRDKRDKLFYGSIIF